VVGNVGMSAYYDSISSSYEDLHSQEQERKLRKILSVLDLRPHDAILDVGCGSGLAFDNQNLKACAVRIGLDPALRLVERVPTHGGEPILARGERLPFRDATFDVVLSLTALHHCQPIEAAIDEIVRVGRERFALSILKRSADTARTERVRRAIVDRFDVLSELDDQHDFIFILKRRAQFV